MSPDRLEALALSKDRPATASNLERVGNKTSPEAARWAFAQWELRKKAAKKGLPKADDLLLHWEGIEQATHFAIARYHASLFPKGVLVADLTTGIGSDLISLAERGPVIGFETSEEKAEYARHNLRVLGLEGEIRTENCLTADWKFQYAYVDPSRRYSDHGNGYRHTRIDSFQPNPFELAKRMAILEFGLMKMTPMIQDTVLRTLSPRIDFLSYGRECREGLIFCGKNYLPDKGESDSAEEPRPAYRLPTDMLGDPNPQFQSYAVHVESGETLPTSSPPSCIEEPLAFLYEADPASIRAHGLGTLATRHKLLGLGDSNGYLTANTQVHSPWLTGFRVLAFGHFDKKSVRARLKELGGGVPIVKSRVAKIDVVDLRKELTTKGPATPIIAIYPVGPSLRYAILERLQSPQPPLSS